MNLLLSVFVDTILPIMVLVLGLAVAVSIYILFNKKIKKGGANVKKYDPNDISVTAVESYCSQDEMKFLDYLHMALPKQFIAFPKVGVDNLVEPGKNRLAYNSILSKYVDVVVFYRRTMKPVLVVDLYKESVANDQLRTMDEDVVNVLKAINVKVVKIKCEKAYNIETLRHQLIHSIPDKILAEINASTAIKID